jgi:aconitase B
MKYIIKKGTPLFDRLTTLKEKMKEVNKVRHEFLHQYADEIEYYERYHAIAGGIEAICFKSNPDPKQWKKFDKDAFSPKKSAKELWDKFYGLPYVHNNEFNDIIGFKKAFVGNRVVLRPALNIQDDYYLISVDTEIEYTPVEGMEEIKDSEYKELSK